MPTVETFNKGQLVPRRLRLVSYSDRKAGHGFVFGCDVRVEGRKVIALSDGACFYAKHRINRRMGNGTFKKAIANITNVHFIAYCRN